MKTQKAFLILAGVLAAGANVYGDKVTLSATPPSVQQAIRSKAGSHQIEDIDRDQRNGQMTYEVSWKNSAGVQQELLLSENGNVLRDVQGDNQSSTATPAVNNPGFNGFNKTPVALADTPRAVQASVYTKIPNAPIDSVQRGVWNGRTFYEVNYQENGQPKTYWVDENGKAMERGHWQPQFGTAVANVRLTGPQKVSFDDAPRNVQRTINYVANGAALENLQRGQWNGRTIYLTNFRRNGENIQLEVFDDGSIFTKTPGIKIAGTATAPAKRQSFFDKAAELLGGGATPATTQPAPATSALSLAEAPLAVQQTVNQSAKGAALQDLQRSDWNGRALYEASFQQNGQNMKLQVLDDGSILSMRPASTAVGAPPSTVSGSGQSR